MSLTRPQLILVLGIAAIYFAGQLLTGTDAVVSSLFTAAILFGSLSVFAGGGLQSAFGFLNAVLIGKFLLFAIAVKFLLLEPADGTLKSPLATASVMAIGFFGLFLGTIIAANLPCPKSWSMNRHYSDRMFLALSIVMFVVGYVAYFVALVPETQGLGFVTGGWMGIARTFSILKGLSIVPAMLYLWRTKSRRWMTHPFILVMLTWSTIIGVYSHSKLEMMEPIAFYALTGVLRYGWRDVRLWSLASIGVCCYALIVYPYSQYIRRNGDLEGTFTERAEVTKDLFWRTASDSEFRSAIRQSSSKVEPFYFTQGELVPFSRLAMVGEADKLISATLRQQAFTGWTTIIWGFEFLTPRFLYPDKPGVESDNYLGHIAGDIKDPHDQLTEMAYGIMANFYNAFSLSGVLIGTTLFFALFYFWMRMFVGVPMWECAPTTSALLFLFLVGLCQHHIVESSFSGNIVLMVYLPGLVLVFGILATWLCPFLRQRGSPA